VGGSLTEYTEYVIKFTCSRFNQKWTFAPHFLEFYSFRAFESARTLTARTHYGLVVTSYTLFP